MCHECISALAPDEAAPCPLGCAAPPSQVQRGPSTPTASLPPADRSLLEVVGDCPHLTPAAIAQLSGPVRQLLPHWGWERLELRWLSQLARACVRLSVVEMTTEERRAVAEAARKQYGTMAATELEQQLAEALLQNHQGSAADRCAQFSDWVRMQPELGALACEIEQLATRLGRAADAVGSGLADGTIWCENCEAKMAVSWCCQCECHFCGPCASTIHQSRAMQRHQLSAPDSSPTADPRCVLHGQPVVATCTTCSSAPLCALCIEFGDHSDHPYSLLAESAVELRQQLQQMHQRCEKQHTAIRAASGELSIVAAQLDSSSHEEQPKPLAAAQAVVERHFYKLRAQLRDREEQLLGELAAAHQRKIELVVCAGLRASHMESKSQSFQSRLKAAAEVS